ncbi:hypothetical protein B7P43_G16337 [Cryptotermes secundus]|uniref:Mos1 transposase HTH domain-containing protein n=1 Tax=Cryptotermes secundus TaxID=105785 RepID=A0A2J7QIL8_9NEOP|nr:hypothetical protein B7P43_G16337 [Cryptotermes secundus]
MLSANAEQRANIKFLTKLGKSATETYNLLTEVYGDQCLSRTQVFEWFKKFMEGRKNVGNDPKSGRTRFESVDAVKAKATQLLKSITQDDLQHCFQQWKIRMERCRDRGGDYIEGDNISTV